MTPLHPDDGHTLCLTCLGFDHLREALMDAACMNCITMSREMRLTRLDCRVQLPTGADTTGLEPVATKLSGRADGPDPLPVKRRRVASEGTCYGRSSRRTVEDMEHQEQRMDRMELYMQELLSCFADLPQRRGGSSPWP